MSEATPVTVAEPRTLESLTPTQYNTWRLKGELPTEKSEETPAPKATEKPAEAKAEPATESGAEAPKQEPKVSKLGYSDLRRKVREQEAEIERLKSAPREKAKVEPDAEVEVKPKAEAKADPRPRQNDLNQDGTPKYKDWSEYEDELLSWNRRQAMSEFEQTLTKRQQEQEIAKANRAIETSWKERVDAAKDKHEDFDHALDPKDGPGAEINSGSFLDRWILESELGAELLYHFDSDRKELRRIGNLSVTAAARELSKLETKLSGEPTPEKAPPVEKPEPRATKVTPPAREVGGRGTTAGDEVVKAVAEDDFTSFKNAANRRDIAAKKR